MRKEQRSGRQRKEEGKKAAQGRRERGGEQTGGGQEGWCVLGGSAHRKEGTTTQAVPLSAQTYFLPLSPSQEI